jgi:hypothetical protein
VERLFLKLFTGKKLLGYWNKTDEEKNDTDATCFFHPHAVSVPQQYSYSCRFFMHLLFLRNTGERSFVVNSDGAWFFKSGRKDMYKKTNL